MNKEVFCQTIEEFVKQVKNKYHPRHQKNVLTQDWNNTWAHITLLSQGNVTLNKLEPNKIYVRYFGDTSAPALDFMGIISNPVYGMESAQEDGIKWWEDPEGKLAYWSLMGYLGDSSGRSQVAPALSRGIGDYMERATRITMKVIYWNDEINSFKWNGWSNKNFYIYELDSAHPSFFLNWLVTNPLVRGIK